MTEMPSMLKKSVILFLMAWAFPAMALKTAYVSFDHPDGWRCELSQGVWICQSTLEGERRESVVLSIATMATEWDSVDNYLEYLKKPRTITDDQGKPVQAEVKYARKRDINGVTWVDSLQSNSELPGFWSRYVATVHNKLAILITYVVSDEQYKRLAPQFDRMVASMRPNAEFDLNIATKQGETPLPGASKLGPSTADILRNRLKPTAGLSTKLTAETGDDSEGESGGMGTILITALAAGATVWFLRRRKNRRKGPPPGQRAA